MSVIRHKKLIYNWLKNRWYLSVRSDIAPSQKHVYWGSTKQPLTLTLRPRTHRKHRITQDEGNVEDTEIVQTGWIELGDHQPRLGPLVGILTSSSSSSKFAGMKQNFADIIHTGTQLGAIIFVFTPEMVNWHKQQTGGFLLHRKLKTWRKTTFPLPNLVYNRVPRRDIEAHPLVQTCLNKLQNTPQLNLFNQSFFNKETIFNDLQSSVALQRYLPATEKLHPSTLKKMLHTWPTVYLKPSEGKAGSGILKTIYDEQSHSYELQWQAHKSLKRIRCRSFTALWRRVLKYKQYESYIIQQGIPLCTFAGHPFDFRVLVQKNDTGQWQVTGIGVRVAGKERITTHVPRGGRIVSVQDVLSAEQRFTIERELMILAVQIAAHLEKSHSPLGEMSMDIGLDQQGHLWFFEANSKPMKFDEPHIRRKSLENIVKYAQYLTFHQYAKGADTHALHPTVL